MLVHNTAAFQSRYGTAPLILGDYASTGKRSTTLAGTVHLQDPYGLTIADFTYSPAWYPATKGGGASLPGDRPGRRPRLQRPRRLATQHRHRRRPRHRRGARTGPANRCLGPRFRHRRSTCNGRPARPRRQGYLVFRGSGNGQFTKVASLPASATTYNDNNGGAGLSPGTSYEYLIQAYNAAGYSSAADVTAVTLIAAPANLSVSYGSGVVLTWSAQPAR